MKMAILHTKSSRTHSSTSTLMLTAGWWLLFAWLGSSLFLSLELVELVFLGAPLVLIPLVSAWTPSDPRSHPAVWKRSAAIAAMGAALSFAFESGLMAGILSVGWLFWTIANLAADLASFMAAGHRSSKFMEVVSSIYLVTGAIWFCATRFGLSPFGFPIGISFLTAVHFHFGGYLLSRCAIWLSSERPRGLARASAVGILAGFPVVAFGMLFWPAIELVGVAVLLYSEIIFVLELVRFAWSERPVLPIRAASLIVAASASMAAVLAAVYSYAEFRATILIPIPAMIAWHGMLNAIGTVGGSILIWGLHRRSQTRT